MIQWECSNTYCFAKNLDARRYVDCLCNQVITCADIHNFAARCCVLENFVECIRVVSNTISEGARLASRDKFRGLDISVVWLGLGVEVLSRRESCRSDIGSDRPLESAFGAAA